MDTHRIIPNIFGANRALIGVIHVGALPGTPSYERNLPEIVNTAVEEARAYAAAGFHGLLLENTHDRPYLKGSVGSNLRDYDAADALIVGSDVKRDGVWSHPLDETRVRAIANAFHERRA